MEDIPGGELPGMEAGGVKKGEGRWEKPFGIKYLYMPYDGYRN